VLKQPHFDARTNIAIPLNLIGKSLRMLGTLLLTSTLSLILTALPEAGGF
jgi:hypothetical protein